MNYNLKHRNSGESSSIVEIIRSETTVSSLLEIVACEVTNMAKKTLSPLIALLIAAALISALLLNTWQAFRLTSDLTRSSGRYHLESISGELSATIGDAERLAMRLAIQAQPYVWDKVALEEFIHERKKEVLAQGKGCFNVYMAGSGWTIIPDFNMPDDYIATEREWYKGAMRAQGDTYVTAPYDSENAKLEKSFVTLASFGKTGLLQPGETETVPVKFPRISRRSVSVCSNRKYLYPITAPLWILVIREVPCRAVIWI